MSHEKQHWVPSSYLKAWVDLSLPKGRKGQVWLYTKNGKWHETKSPKRIFFERELYTGQNSRGERDIFIEEKFLNLIENNFIKARDKLVKTLTLSPTEFNDLLLFAAAMLNRTMEQNNFFKNQWEKSVDHITQIQQQENRRKGSINIDSIRQPPSQLLSNHSKIAKAPLYHMLQKLTQVTFNQMLRMNCNILRTSNLPGFITSDNPCVLFDPDINSRPPLYQTRGLCYPRIEITLPITPQLLIYCHKNNELLNNRLIPITDDAVDNLNKNTWEFCTNYFVVNKEITKEIWFEHRG